MGEPENRTRLIVGDQDFSIGVLKYKPLVHGLDRRCEHVFALIQSTINISQFDQLSGLIGHCKKALDLQSREVSWLCVDATEGADGLTSDDDGGTGIKSKVKIAGNQFIVGESHVEGGVGDNQRLGLQNRMRAKCHIARSFANV